MKCDCCDMTYKELRRQYPHKKITFNKIKGFNICSECWEDHTTKEISEDIKAKYS